MPQAESASRRCFVILVSAQQNHEGIEARFFRTCRSARNLNSWARYKKVALSLAEDGEHIGNVFLYDTKVDVVPLDMRPIGKPT
jgi:hypothetical protein